MVCVLAEPLERRWHAGPCSGAGLCAFLGLVIIVVAPLLVCIRTGGFLLEEATYREDPLVFFQNEIVVTALDSAGLPIMTWTSIPEINAMLGDALRFPVVTARERDANFDGRPEDLEIDISLPLLGTEHVASVNLMLGFSYELQDAADMTMQSLAYISEATTGNPRELFVSGDLSLVQRRPLPSFGRRTVYNTSVLRSNTADASAFTFAAILSEYSARNETTRLTHVYSTWSHPRVGDNAFVITARVHYPSQVVVYTPTFWHEFKFVWVQYVAVLLPFLWAVVLLKKHALHKGMLLAIPQDPQLSKPHAD